MHYRIAKVIPPLCEKCRALLPASSRTNVADIAECPNCHQRYAAFLPDWITPDEDVSFLFGRVVEELIERLGYSFDDACTLAREYHTKFAASHGEDFFFHEAPGGVALRAHYCLRLPGDPLGERFIEWRTDFYRARRGQD